MTMPSLLPVSTVANSKPQEARRSASDGRPYWSCITVAAKACAAAGRGGDAIGLLQELPAVEQGVSESPLSAVSCRSDNAIASDNSVDVGAGSTGGRSGDSPERASAASPGRDTKVSALRDCERRVLRDAPAAEEARVAPGASVATATGTESCAGDDVGAAAGGGTLAAETVGRGGRDTASRAGSLELLPLDERLNASLRVSSAEEEASLEFSSSEPSDRTSPTISDGTATSGKVTRSLHPAKPAQHDGQRQQQQPLPAAVGREGRGREDGAGGKRERAWREALWAAASAGHASATVDLAEAMREGNGLTLARAHYNKALQMLDEAQRGGEVAAEGSLDA